ncbi:MCE family protein, partial [Saccharomonospora iraqiensis]|uniref:MCE family protein n=1 Tax=Saccharomonospora iraqiensis TaxID=52698 RepID=UPI00022E0001
MRLTGRNKVLLLVFGLISVLAVGYAGGKYAGLDRLVTGRGYSVHVELASSGGIFEGAEVAYRGVTVGQVRSLDLDGDGLTVELDISDDAPPIPDDTDAVVANRSAVGEQYVDLRPRRDGAPYLEPGAVIPRERTDTPVMPHDLLAGAHDLLSSVDPKSVRTVVDEAHEAFRGVGPDLQRLLDATGSFTAAARENLPETRQLLADGRVVLRTQREQGDELLRIADGFSEIAGALKEADPDLRTVVDRAPGLSREVDEFLAETGTSTGVLLANLLTTTRITAARTDAVEQLLVALPMASAFSKSVSSNGEGHLGLVLNFFDPPSCTKGYETTPKRGADETEDLPPNTEAYCAEPPGSPISVRGAQNVPRADGSQRNPGGADGGPDGGTGSGDG